MLNGDLSGAQSAFASIQQVVSTQSSNNSNSILSQLGQSSSTLGQDLQAVSTALSANDISGAQKAFAKLQQDMQSVGQANGTTGAHHGHHAQHAKGNDGDADDAGAGSAQASQSSAALANLFQSMSNSQSTGSTANDLLSALQSLANTNPKVAGDLVTLMTDMNNTGKVVITTA